MKNFKKRLYTFVWTVIVLLGIYVCVRGFSVIVFNGMENPLNNVINNFTGAVGKDVMNMYMPSVTSSIADKEKNTVTQAIINEVLEDYPILKYFDENNGYETSADSEYTYEMIIAAEATDENYINQETGEAINSAGELVAEENAQYIERENNSSNTNSDSLDSSDETLVNETNTNENTEQQTAQQEEGNSAKAVNQGTVTAITGTEYSLEKLADFDFLKNTFYSVDSTTSVDSERINAKNMLERDMTIQKDTSVPQILIYHTHSQEAFVDSIEGDASTTIVGVGEYLAEILAGTYGYNVIHNSSTYDMVNGKIDRNYAFTLAEPDIKRILQENPSIQVVIDLHRDGINENTHLVTDVNGKPTAQFMFFNGLSYNTKVGNIEYLYNPYIEDNLAFSFQMQLQAMKLYPNVTRKIYLKGYRYNLHLMPRATLIEIGGQTNTVEEAKNAMEPLADIINKVLEGN
ncbi:stage II sporulation protein P [Lachnotalea glycerini]|uniref:Stage II sporulation protein P n=2 Tax=Lachnotalea glycerini TaxID=1763509 RepID=A0A318EL70_9FIRM|nr:stage II sporulation protein P [Lachnotalea glycerini]PXV89486.1 stage II sporulation protein P [Lachnotalea glycerini]